MHSVNRLNTIDIQKLQKNPVQDKRNDKKYAGKSHNNNDLLSLLVFYCIVGDGNQCSCTGIRKKAVHHILLILSF